MSKYKIPPEYAEKLKAIGITRKENLAKNRHRNPKPFGYFATHDGKWHADDILAELILNLLDATVIRASRKELETLNKKYVKFDCGGGMFDHHHENSQMRPDGIPFSSIGLIWKHYAPQIKSCILYRFIDKEYIDILYDRLDNEFIKFIDANDNGVDIKGRFDWFGSAAMSFNVGDEKTRSFLTSVTLNMLFNNIVQTIVNEIKSEEIVVKALELAIAKNRKYIILQEAVPWQKIVCDYNAAISETESKITSVAFQRHDGDWSIQQVPVSSDSFVLHCELPSEDFMISCVSEIDTFIFRHKNGFIGGYRTQLAAMEMLVAFYES